MSAPGQNFLSDDERNQLVQWRRDFHAHPELGYHETRTSGIVSRHLQESGYDVKTGVGGTGVVGLLNVPHAAKTVMLRADMDCLPVQEENDVPYRSQETGRMHACGHDGHTAVLMMVAKKLMAHRDRIRNNVKLVFQPAEEGGNGAERMIQDGALENPKVDVAFGLHVYNNQPVGKVALNPGALMAGVDTFEITIIGKGGHGAAPHQTIDPIVIAAQVVNNLQTVVSRNTDPLATAVVTVGSIHAGNAFNVIAESAKLLGTTRYFDRLIGNELPAAIERIVSGTAAAFGAQYKLDYRRTCPPTINNSDQAAFIRQIGIQVVGEKNVMMDARTMGGEDMSFFLNEVPGCYFFIGSANESRNLSHPHHSSKFDFDEAALFIGAEMLYRAVEQFS